MIDNRRARHYVEAMTWTVLSIRVWLALAAMLLMVLVATGVGVGAGIDANAASPGQTLDINSLVTPGKTTLIDFHSPYCPPCVRLAPLMEQLAAERQDLAICKVDINRPGVNGIDWRSPLAQQYQIRQVPFFMIFNNKGKLVAQGRDAMDQVQRWLRGSEVDLSGLMDIFLER
jgi:thiol-disulfide isomerase/thioredoxin